MKKIIEYLIVLVLILLLSTSSSAHPIDRDQDLPEVLNPGGNPAFEQCHDDQWHERRTLFTLMRYYAECKGRAELLSEDLGWPMPLFQFELLDYPNRIPAHPIVDKPGDLQNCKAHLEAAIFTRVMAESLVIACGHYVSFAEIMRG